MELDPRVQTVAVCMYPTFVCFPPDLLPVRDLCTPSSDCSSYNRIFSVVTTAHVNIGSHPPKSLPELPPPEIRLFNHSIDSHLKITDLVQNVPIQCFGKAQVPAITGLRKI